MAHTTHTNHEHVHGGNCGHTPVKHGDHVDYMHEGHLHHSHNGHTDECTIAVDATNPSRCTPSHQCSGHAQGHTHGPDCGHEGVPHGDHVDYLVEGHLHHVHDSHCDDHGPLRTM
ncbi:hypothetical protein LZ198_18170 [Myxococcus sp. K15C18031901]|uniref:hypothetical protein n=1 Tax=Myxococcus dinghuensis TaxID=2906761 RepID=UPI0020A7944E|nr:hypothetical protein [Myxococcus dinghuensis]MCP3100800.1 hypothetical protein [Myxococcus dinghuensis]